MLKENTQRFGCQRFCCVSSGNSPSVGSRAIGHAGPVGGVRRELAEQRRRLRDYLRADPLMRRFVKVLPHEDAPVCAREEGIPYQTLLPSVIHKYLSGRLTEKR